MNRRPLPHTSLPNTATGDKLPNPPIPSCFYYTPWACKEQLQGEKGGWENRQQEVGVKKKKNRLIDSNTMTVGRCTGQTKAGTGNHNLQYQKDMCACHFWCWKSGGTQNHLALHLQIIVSDKIHLLKDPQTGLSISWCIISEALRMS